MSLKKLLNKLDPTQPATYVAVLVSGVFYYLVAYFLQTWLYAGPLYNQAIRDRLISDMRFAPEPLESFIYILSFLIIPLLAASLVKSIDNILNRIRKLITKKLIIFSIALIIVAGIIAAIKLFNHPFVIEYLATHSIWHALWLLFTKRIFVLRIIVLLTALVGIASYIFIKKKGFLAANPQVEKNLKWFSPIFFIFLALLLYHPNLPYDQHHFNYFLGGVQQIIHGKLLLYETVSLYGVLNIYFLTLIFKIIPFTYHAFSLIVYVFYLLFFLGVFYSIKLWLNSYRFAYLGTLGFVAISYFLQISPYQSAFEFPNAGPWRQGLYILALLLIILFINKKKRVYQEATLVLAAIAPFWSFDVGLYLAAATFITFAWFNAVKENEIKEKIKSIIVLAIRMLAYFIGVWLIISLVNYNIVGSWPNWLATLQNLLAYRVGFDMDLLPVVGFFLLIVSAYLLSLIFVINNSVDKKHINLPLIFLTIYGIFAFNYYVGNSVWALLYYGSTPLILITIYYLHFWSTEKLNQNQQRAARAIFYSFIFLTIAIFIVKIPVEFANRDYSAKNVLYTIPADEQLLYEDAQFILQQYPLINEVPIIHKCGARFLYFMDRTNLFNFFEAETIIWQEQMDQIINDVETKQPEIILVGQDDNRVIRTFISRLPGIYIKTQSLQTLDIYSNQ